MMIEHIFHQRITGHLQEDRIGFEVLLPCEVGTVTGIVALATPGRLNLVSASNRSELAGLLTLAWNAPGHIFFQGPVSTQTRFEYDYQPLGLDAPDQLLTGQSGFADRGTKITPVEVEVPGHLRTLQGYYIDVINRLGGNDENYPIDLFFYYTPIEPSA